VSRAAGWLIVVIGALAGGGWGVEGGELVRSWSTSGWLRSLRIVRPCPSLHAQVSESPGGAIRVRSRPATGL